MYNSIKKRLSLCYFNCFSIAHTNIIKRQYFVVLFVLFLSFCIVPLGLTYAIANTDPDGGGSFKTMTQTQIMVLKNIEMSTMDQIENI